MEKETKDIIKLTSKEILSYFINATLLLNSFVTKSLESKIEIDRYFDGRNIDRQNFTKKIHYLKEKGLIRKFSENKTTYLELTPKGKKRVENLVLANIIIERPIEWDRRWRVVMFDIPEKEKLLRHAIRRQLYKLGFKQVQKSVFVYPFECSQEINFICNHLGGRQYLKYMISDIIEGEESIIKEFLDSKVLNKKDIIN